MQAYKTQLRRQLAVHGWEVVEVLASDEWWLDEFWRVQSRRNRWGLEIILAFLVDPQWADPRRKRQGVWKVAALEQLPTDWLTPGFAELCLLKGRFDEKLRVFITALDDFRNHQGSAAEEPT